MGTEHIRNNGRSNSSMKTKNSSVAEVTWCKVLKWIDIEFRASNTYWDVLEMKRLWKSYRNTNLYSDEQNMCKYVWDAIFKQTEATSKQIYLLKSHGMWIWTCFRFVHNLKIWMKNKTQQKRRKQNIEYWICLLLLWGKSSLSFCFIRHHTSEKKKPKH